MKKLLFVLTLTFLFISCNDNSSSDRIVDIPSEDLIGSWDLLSMTSDAVTTINYQGVPIKFDTEVFGKNINYTYTFTENPNELLEEGSLTAVIKISTNGFTQTQEEILNTIDGFGAGTWVEENGVITVSTQGQSVKAYVENYVNNKLTLRILLDYKESTTYEGQSVEADINGEMYLTIEKLI